MLACGSACSNWAIACRKSGVSHSSADPAAPGAAPSQHGRAGRARDEVTLDRGQAGVAALHPSGRLRELHPELALAQLREPCARADERVEEGPDIREDDRQGERGAAI